MLRRSRFSAVRLSSSGFIVSKQIDFRMNLLNTSRSSAILVRCPRHVNDLIRLFFDDEKRLPHVAIVYSMQ